MYKKVSNILCVAAFIGAMSLNSQSAMAQAPVPTLDNLHNQGAINPATQDKDDQGNPIDGTGTVYPESAYTLTEIENADPDNLPQNAITLYDKNEDGTVTPKYYLVTLKDSVTNIGEGDTTKYFEWTKNETTGNLEFKEVSAPTSGKQTITVNYDTTNLQTRLPNSTDQSDTTITGTFLNLSTGNTSGNQYGGAIYNRGISARLGDINADFIGNYVYSTGPDFYAYGGAIYNEYETIGDITGDFIGNSASAIGNSSSVIGGAIYNNGFGAKASIGEITGNFIGNSVSGDYNVYGGAIYNYGDYRAATIGDITSNFIGNYALSANSNASGGAIGSSNGKIGYITGDFVGNYASGNTYAYGGAIYNKNYYYSNNISIENITGDFIGNYASSNSSAYGGAIYNLASLVGDIKGNFHDNHATAVNNNAQGGAIFNNYSRLYDSSGLQIVGVVNGILNSIEANFTGNYAKGSNAYGGAIYNSGSLEASNGLETIKEGIINSSFINNYAQSTAENGIAQGGAIYTNMDLDIIAKDGGQSVFSGNYTETNGIKKANAIYVLTRPNLEGINTETNIISINNNIVTYQEITKNEKTHSLIPTLTLNANTNGTIVFDDTIDGNVVTVGTSTSTISRDLLISDSAKENYGVSTVEAYIAYLKAQGRYDEDTPDDRIISSGIYYGDLEIINEQIISTEEADGEKYSYSLNITGDSTGKVILNNKIINANISIDNTNVYVNEGTNLSGSKSLAVNSGVLNIQHLNNQTVNFERFSNAGTINLASVDVDLQKESMGRITADEYGESTGKINVQGVNLLNDATKDITNVLFADEQISSSVAYTGASPIAYSPIYKYEVSYNPDDGFFTFSRGGGASSGSYDAYNPAVLSTSVAQQAGAYTTQLQTFNFAFQHADTFMNIPYLERVAIINAGKYALSPTGDATDVGTFSPLLTKEEDAGFWVKPYASFENVPLKNGPKVSNINYGTLIGYDSPLTSVAHGFERVLTAYIGYNGASQRYQGVDAYQNGGLIGGTATFYKGNFFNATTLSVGATAGDASTMYGSENYTMLLAGIGNKTGYNFEFWNGKVILQPNFLISYTFVNTFDYNNAAGVRIESDPLHAIQLSPGLKLIGNTKNGWQPYIGVNMVWNLLDDSRVTANDVRLPEMSIRPYVQYGVGVQKRFKDKFLAFGQAMIHNGGRNGVSLTAGLRWKVGRE